METQSVRISENLPDCSSVASINKPDVTVRHIHWMSEDKMSCFSFSGFISYLMLPVLSNFFLSYHPLLPSADIEILPCKWKKVQVSLLLA